jgi:hypothetical protein
VKNFKFKPLRVESMSYCFKSPQPKFQLQVRSTPKRMYLSHSGKWMQVAFSLSHSSTFTFTIPVKPYKFLAFPGVVQVNVLEWGGFSNSLRVKIYKKNSCNFTYFSVGLVPFLCASIFFILWRRVKVGLILLY